MGGERVERRLAAVLAADVAGYSRLMGIDEEGTLARLKAFRKSLVDPTIASYRGRIVKTTGDGMLVEFASAVDAVRSAFEVQRGMAEQNVAVPQDHRIEFRIGVHIGDIIFDDDDIFGDGVNIAARLEGIAEPGGVCISEDAYRQVRGKVEIAYDDLGPQNLKNIAEPMRAWRILVARQKPSAIKSGSTANEPKEPPLPDKPSIAVLPFQNMSGDPEQEYFADGMVEDIITALSQFKSLFVIARNSSFTYKGTAVDIKQVGRDLGVRYVLEGSVRKAGARVRITGQLIDSETGAHLWADRFDGAIKDVFDLQDRVTAGVATRIFSRVQVAEEERAVRKPTYNLDAYDYYLRGMANVWKWSKEGSEAALAQFSKAIELDPSFACAYAFASNVATFRKQSRWMIDVAEETSAAVQHARRAVELGRDDALALALSGFSFAYVADELDLGADCIGRALSLNANLAWAWHFSGWVHVYLGEPLIALEHLARFERLSPRDPALVQNRLATALAHFFAGQYQQAVRLTDIITVEAPTLLAGWRIRAISSAMGGDPEAAAAAVRKVQELDPSARVPLIVRLLPLRRPEDRGRYREGLLKAGFPD